MKNGSTFAAMSCGTDTDFLLFSRDTGIWAYDNEKGILENRVPLADIGFGSNVECCPLIFLPDGRLVLTGGDGDDIRIKYVPAGR